VQRILGRADGLCNKKIALRALSLTNQSILHAVMQFAACGVQTFITCGNHSLQFYPLFASIESPFLRVGLLKTRNLRR
jgi:hypothetical protein